MTQEEYNRELADAQARGDWAGVAWLTNYMNPSTPGLGRLGFQTLGWSRTPGSFKGMPLLPETAPEGQLYLYPDGGLSNISGPGASLLPKSDAISRAGTPTSPTTYDEWLLANPEPDSGLGTKTPGGAPRIPNLLGGTQYWYQLDPTFQSTYDKWSQWRSASDAAKKQFSTGTSTTTPPGTTPPPGTTTTPGNITDAAKNLASVTKPTVPNFIQPYQNVNKGFKQAFGEQDLNW